MFKEKWAILVVIPGENTSISVVTFILKWRAKSLDFFCVYPYY